MVRSYHISEYSFLGLPKTNKTEDVMKYQVTEAYARRLANASLKQRLVLAFITQSGYDVFTRHVDRSLSWKRDTASAPQLSNRYSSLRVVYGVQRHFTIMCLPFGKLDWR
jgi:hypothetical protein